MSAEPKFIIRWKYRNKTGYGTKMYAKVDADRICAYLNENSPLIERWVEPVQPAAEPVAATVQP